MSREFWHREFLHKILAFALGAFQRGFGGFSGLEVERGAFNDQARLDRRLESSEHHSSVPYS